MPTLRVEVVDDVARFDDLRAEWDGALTASADPNVFLTWDWLRTWWRHFGETDERAELHVVTIRDADGLVAAAPLHRMTDRTGPLRTSVLRPVCYDAGDYGGILLVRHHDDAVDALLGHLAAEIDQGATAVTLSRLADDSTFLTRLRARLPSLGRVTATEAPLDGACLYADVRDGYDLRKHLKKHKVRQRLHRLEEKYEVAFTWHSGATLEDGIERMLAVHRLRWEGRETDLRGLLAAPEHEAFLLDALRALDARNALRLLVLTADGRTVGVELDFELARRVSMFKAAFDPAFGEFSPGQLLNYRTMEDGIARGVEEFDFLRGDYPYKRRWTNGERHLATVTLTLPGLAGRLATTRLRAQRVLRRYS